jgi:hypothetical protein
VGELLVLVLVDMVGNFSETGSESARNSGTEKVESNSRVFVLLIKVIFSFLAVK